MAQSYADQCRGLTHSSSVGRWTKRFGSCGENIFIATHKVPWHFAIKSWFSEKDLFNYGCGGNNLTQARQERELQSRWFTVSVSLVEECRGSHWSRGSYCCYASSLML